MSALERALSRVAGRVRLAIGRAVVNLVNDAAKLQAVQVTLRADEVRDNAEHFQHYGFTSVPLPGAEGLGLAVGGSTDHLVVINVDDRRYRKKGLLPGQVALYTKWGDYILLKENEIEIVHATKIKMTAPTFELNGNVVASGNLQVGGAISAAGDVSGAGKSLSTHVHGGVQAGSGQTTPPV